jgi:uncharacterized membrane protein
MIEFLIALGAFLGAHLIPASPRIRARLIDLMGRAPYLVAYSILSLALLGWLIVAAQRAESVVLWDAAPWQWQFAFLMMPVATFFLVAGLLAPNPLSISFRAGSEGGAIASITRHPIVWAFLIWSVAHIPPNGDLVSVILFGGMAMFSLLGFTLLDAKARRRLGPDRWRILAKRTSIVPFAALLTGRTGLTNVRELIVAGGITAALYLWFILQGHQLLIGLDPLSTLRYFG